MYFPFVTSKGFAFRIITEIIISAWIILALLHPEYRPKSSWILRSYTAFLIIISISTIFSCNPSKSFWGNFERMEGLIFHLHLFAFFLVASSVMTTEKLWSRFWNISLVVSLGVAFFGLAQLAHIMPIHEDKTRIDALFGNTTFLAVYLVYHIFIALFFLFRSTSKPARFAYGLLAVLHVFLLYQTQTRSAMLGFLVGFFLCGSLMLWSERKNKTIRKVAVASMVTVILSIGGFIALKDTPFIQHNPILTRFTDISYGPSNSQARYYIWPMAVKGFLERPLTGWGMENFNYVFNKYYDPHMYQHEQFFERAHNAFFDWLVAAGAFGFLCYLSLFISGLWLLWEKCLNLSQVDRSILTGLLAGYFFHNIFFFDNLTSYLLFFTLLAYIHTARSRSPAPVSMPAVRGRVAYVMIPFIIVFLGGSIYFVNARPILASRAIVEGGTPRGDGNVWQNRESFKRALLYHTFGDAEAREHLVKTAKDINSAGRVSAQVKEAFFTLARTELQKQIDQTPGDARYQLMMGNMLNDFGRYREAIPYLEATLALTPKKQSAILELSKSYWGLGNITKAREVSNTAYVWLGDSARDLYTRPYESASEFQRGRSVAQFSRITFRDLSDKYSNKQEAVDVKD